MRVWMWMVAGTFLACGHAGSPPSRAPIEAAPPRLEPSQNKADAGATDKPVTVAHCVLHAGEIVRSTHWARKAGEAYEPSAHESRCAYNAECGEQRGVASPGDGLVALECQGRACVCRIESFGGPQPSRRQFTFEAECETGEQAQTLLKERCIAAAARGSTDLERK